MNKLRIAIGSDHAGFEYKEAIAKRLNDDQLKDFGTYSPDSADYPDFAHPVASAVERGEFDYGILVCGSANGVAITANKHQGIRAAICWNEELASLARISYAFLRGLFRLKTPKRSFKYSLRLSLRAADTEEGWIK
jgi:ribose 5-phosphate isomerase B